MSYSRWSNSVWYTYWTSLSPSNEKDDQLFEICDFRASVHLSYGDLKHNYDAGRLKEFIINEVIFTMASNPIHIKDGIYHPPSTLDEAYTAYSPEEYDELVGYAKDFMADVEEEFSQKDKS